MVRGATATVGRVVGFGGLFGIGLFLFGVREAPAATADPSQAPDASVAFVPLQLDEPATPANIAIKTATPPLATAGGPCPPGHGRGGGRLLPVRRAEVPPLARPRHEDALRRVRADARTARYARRHKHFCIDRYEYPNEPGAEAAGDGDLVRGAGTSAPARASASAATASGRSRARARSACRIRTATRATPTRATSTSRTRTSNERLFVDPRDARRRGRAPRPARAVSGSRDACVSPYGVYDMTGNVDEWVVNESGQPVQERPEGRLLGSRARPLPADDDGARRELHVLPDRLPLLLRRGRCGLVS